MWTVPPLTGLEHGQGQLLSCVALSKVLNPSEPQFPRERREDVCEYLSHVVRINSRVLCEHRADTQLVLSKC